jgi:hypothetical protein
MKFKVLLLIFWIYIQYKEDFPEALADKLNGIDLFMFFHMS